MKDTEKSR